MQKIKRKTLLYRTGVEYGDYTINHVQGCAHGCKFPCYAMMMAKRFGTAKKYEEWCVPKLAENALEILDKEIQKMKDKIESVHLCFSTLYLKFTIFYTWLKKKQMLLHNQNHQLCWWF